MKFKLGSPVGETVVCANEIGLSSMYNMSFNFSGRNMFTTSPGGAKPHNLRTDIQVLRGVAVLFVLLYHAKIGPSAGYLGVDIFFVISGFLITGLIKRDVDAGRFSFKNFYFRRAKRLLPAAYVTFFITALVAPLFLTASEMSNFKAQMIGAVTFTANMLLYKQTGYFGGGAELKPLLHTWSLSIEEQYYFVLPLTLALIIPKRHWIKGALFITIASLGLCMYLSGASLAFYMLPTRAWELGIGSIAALATVTPLLEKISKFAFWPSVIALVTVPSLGIPGPHPGLGALVVCLATSIVILRRHPLLSKGDIVNSLSRTGDLSYSLYLVHWPVFAFLNNVWIAAPGDAPPIEVRIALVGVSFAFAYALYRFVEKPIHYASFDANKKSVATFVTTSACLVLATAGVAQATKGEKDYQFDNRDNVGLATECSYRDSFERLPACQTSSDPSIIVWGDSYAMHWVAGVKSVADDGNGVVQATKSMCGPIMNFAVLRTVEYNRAWAERCIKFSQSVIDYIKASPSIKTVILSSPFHQFTDPSETLLRRDRSTGEYQVVKAGVEEAAEAFSETVRVLQDAGKNVIVISPTPQNGADVARCAERRERELLTVGPLKSCQIDLEGYQRRRAAVLEFIGKIEREKNIRLVNLDRYLCNANGCETKYANQPIYRDSGHLSYGGSITMAKAIELKELIADPQKSPRH